MAKPPARHVPCVSRQAGDDCRGSGTSSPRAGCGFVEPLESTRLQLIIDGVGRLIQNFPERSFQPSLAAEFNRKMLAQYESVRDFIVLHYRLDRRTDPEFWRWRSSKNLAGGVQSEITVDGRTAGWLVIAPVQTVSDAATLRFIDSQLQAALVGGAQPAGSGEGGGACHAPAGRRRLRHPRAGAGPRAGGNGRRRSPPARPRRSACCRPRCAR